MVFLIYYFFLWKLVMVNKLDRSFVQEFFIFLNISLQNILDRTQQTFEFLTPNR